MRTQQSNFDALAFGTSANTGDGMPVSATEVAANAPQAMPQSSGPSSSFGDTSGQTLFALADGEPQTSVPRPLVPSETISQILSFETAIADSRLKIKDVERKIADFAQTVESYRASHQPNAIILRSIEQNLEVQKATLAAMQSTSNSLQALYDKALRTIDEQNLRLANIEGSVTALDQKVKEWSDKMTTVPVVNASESRPEILQLATQQGDGAGTTEYQDSAFFHHPRVEASFTRIDTFGVTASVGAAGTYLGAQAAVHVEMRYGVETIVAASATVASEDPTDVASSSVVRPLFTSGGVTNRKASSLCIVFAQHVVNPSTQLGVSLGAVSAAAMASRLDQSEARRVSEIFNHDKGASFGAIKRRCDAFYAKVMREAPPAADMSQVRPEFVHQATSCYSDIDCKHSLDDAIPSVQTYMISECRHKAADKKGICETRVVEGGHGQTGNGCHPTTYDYGFVWPCSKGLVCSGYESSWWSRTPGQCKYPRPDSIKDSELDGHGKIRLRNWRRGLAHVGLAADNVRQVGTLAVADMTPTALSNACEKAGLPSSEGWRLPSVRELWAIGVYDREMTRDKVMQKLIRRGGFYKASTWYYADAAFQGLIWSSDAFVYLRERQGTIPVDPSDKGELSKLVPNSPAGSLYCVKGRPVSDEMDLGD